MKYWRLRTTIIICSLVIISVGFMDFNFTTPDFSLLQPLASPSVTPLPSLKPRPSIAPRVLNPSRLWDSVQNYRLESGYKQYTEDERLCTIARKRLSEVETDWSHEGFWKYTEDFSHNGMAENLGRDYWPESELMNAWKFSPSHKENLDKPYRYSCIETEGLYAVQIFANF